MSAAILRIKRMEFVGNRNRAVHALLTDGHPSIMAGKRICINCTTEKPLKEFHRSKYGELGRSVKCGECAKAYANKKSKGRKYERKGYQLKIRYGISLETFRALLQTQENSCAVCRVELSAESRSAVVDHCHKTGRIRGILCRQCNTGLGHMKDSRKVLTLAAAYLAKHGAQ